MFVQSALHQLKVAVDTSIQMLDQYTEIDLKIAPIQSKRSLFEMYAHLSLICHADLLILNGSTEKSCILSIKNKHPKQLRKCKNDDTGLRFTF